MYELYPHTIHVHYKELKIVWGKYIVSLDCVFLWETNEENRHENRVSNVFDPATNVIF